MTTDATTPTMTVHSLREVLLHELARRVPSDEGPVMQIQLVERALVQLAIGGDLAAIKEIHERGDGKVPSPPRPQKKPAAVTVQWLDADEKSHEPDAL